MTINWKPAGSIAEIKYDKLFPGPVPENCASCPVRSVTSFSFRTAEAPTFSLVNKRPIVADDAEIADNPRARSAKLRVAERTDAPPRDDSADAPLPRLPSLDDVMGGG